MNLRIGALTHEWKDADWINACQFLKPLAACTHSQQSYPVALMLLRTFSTDNAGCDYNKETRYKYYSQEWSNSVRKSLKYSSSIYADESGSFVEGPNGQDRFFAEDGYLREFSTNTIMEQKWTQLKNFVINGEKEGYDWFGFLKKLTKILKYACCMECRKISYLTLGATVSIGEEKIRIGKIAPHTLEGLNLHPLARGLPDPMKGLGTHAVNFLKVTGATTLKPTVKDRILKNLRKIVEDRTNKSIANVILNAASARVSLKTCARAEAALTQKGAYLQFPDTSLLLTICKTRSFACCYGGQRLATVPGFNFAEPDIGAKISLATCTLAILAPTSFHGIPHRSAVIYDSGVQIGPAVPPPAKMPLAKVSDSSPGSGTTGQTIGCNPSGGANCTLEVMKSAQDYIRKAVDSNVSDKGSLAAEFALKAAMAQSSILKYTVVGDSEVKEVDLRWEDFFFSSTEAERDAAGERMKARKRNKRPAEDDHEDVQHTAKKFASLATDSEMVETYAESVPITTPKTPAGRKTK